METLRDFENAPEVSNTMSNPNIDRIVSKAALRIAQTWHVPYHATPYIEKIIHAAIAKSHDPSKQAQPQRSGEYWREKARHERLAGAASSDPMNWDTLGKDEFGNVYEREPKGELWQAINAALAVEWERSKPLVEALKGALWNTPDWRVKAGAALAKVKERLAELQNAKNAAKQIYDGACKILGVENDLEKEDEGAGD